MNVKLKNNMQSGLSKTERYVIDTMTRLGKLIIRAEDIEKEFGNKKQNANLMLSRLCKKHWLQRLSSGTYNVVPFGVGTANFTPEEVWTIAMEIFSPCYVSGWTAAEHWGLTEQIFNSVVIFTRQKQRKKDHLISGINYRTKFIKSENIFGIEKIWLNNKPVQIADIHRTIIDILDDPTIGGGGRHTLDIVKAYWQNKNANIETLYQYAENLKSGAVFKRLGLIAEKMNLPEHLLEKIHTKINTGIIKFDPHGANTGSIITKWGIRINLPLDDFT
jgi:predicted transcriptional regulator of viral defense system